MSSIKTICVSGNRVIAVFKTKEWRDSFANYISSLDGRPFATKSDQVDDYTSFLGITTIELLKQAGYTYIYAKYIDRQHIEDFKQLMED